MNSNFIHRIRIISACVFFVALVIIAKLFFVQIFQGSAYSSKADRQYARPETSNFDRGSIFFTSKDDIKIAAATIKDGYNLSINPKLIKNPDQVYNALSQYITLDSKSYAEKVGDTNSAYKELRKRMDIPLGRSLAQLKIPGVDVTKESWRIYPGGTLASDAIGIIGLDSENKLEGRYGLESYYEQILSRKSSSTNINFFAELFSGIKDTVLKGSIKEGDVITSIEPTVESYLENTLLDTQKKWQSDSIGGIIMDPKTGEIYAMGELPKFDPNDLSNIKDTKILSNSLVENVYEMGSIIKPLTMASGIDSGAIKDNSTYNDTGTLTLSGRKISNFDGKSRGIVPMQEILSQSLNVGVAYISLKMGLEAFQKYFLSYGFGEKTGIDQPNEQKGIIKNLVTGRDVEVATISYGQGIAMTPIQTIRALSVLANDGKLVTPHIVKSIEYIDGTVEEIKMPEPKQVLKKESTDDVTNMLITVVDKALKKGQVKMEHYSIAAKTGTAQIADPVNGGYYKDRYLHSFFGYFPAYNPRFIVFLYHVHPKGAQYASETLTDPFIQLTKLLINYYEISPDR
jgi:cell division protein FtsI (penicillin-binding protein 3)/stage V sporulation protein D (sporulation-specific penicillin-binding protein)